MSASDHLSQQFGTLSHDQLANATSSDFGVPMHEWAGMAKYKHQHTVDDLGEERTHNYDDYGVEGYAHRVGGGRTDDQYDPHVGPVTVSRGTDGGIHVFDGHHRAHDAITRKVKAIPVEWA